MGRSPRDYTSAFKVSLNEGGPNDDDDDDDDDGGGGGGTGASMKAPAATIPPSSPSLPPPPPPPAAASAPPSSPLSISLEPIGYVSSPYKERYGTPRQAVANPLFADPFAKPDGEGKIFLRRDLLGAETLRSLEGFDRVWIIAHMHLNSGWNPMIVPPRGPKVRSRLLRKERHGCFSTSFIHSFIHLINTKIIRLVQSSLHSTLTTLLPTYPLLSPFSSPPLFRVCVDGWLAGWVRAQVKRGVFATRSPHRPSQLALSALELADVDELALSLTVRGLDLLDGTPVLDIKPYLPYCDSFPDASAGWIDDLSG